jgi:hypothetical protein
MDDARRQDLNNRVIGKRYYNTEIDESFTVIGYRDPLLLIQYDDGVGWDELIAPNILNEELATKFDVSEHGIDDQQYRQLGAGPTLQNACATGEHAFYPLPSDLNLDTAEKFHAVADVYHHVVRCKKCGLSGDVLSQFTGQFSPVVCDRCDSDIDPTQEELIWDPTPEWGDANLCGDCGETVIEEFENQTHTCYTCETTLDTTNLSTLYPSSPLGKYVLGDDNEYSDDDIIYLCQDCQKTHADEKMAE